MSSRETFKARALFVEESRKKKGLTQVQLAVRANLSLGSVINIEKGDRAVSLNTMMKIAKALGVAPEKVVGKLGT